LRGGQSVGDVNADGRADLIALNGSSTLVMLSTDRSSFATWSQTMFWARCHLALMSTRRPPPTSLR
jgi:hypothetical protein